MHDGTTYIGSILTALQRLQDHQFDDDQLAELMRVDSAIWALVDDLEETE